jgi:hypothetical protein
VIVAPGDRAIGDRAMDRRVRVVTSSSERITGLPDDRITRSRNQPFDHQITRSRNQPPDHQITRS